MTLIEVVASLALLGALLGSAVVAKSRLTQQWSAAQLRAEGIAALEAQLTIWQAQSAPENSPVSPPGSNTLANESSLPNTITTWPTSGEGPLSVDPWRWRAEVITPTSEQESLPSGLQLVRYTAYLPTASQPVQQLSRTLNRPAATLDVLVYQPTDTEEAPQGVVASYLNRPVQDSGGPDLLLMTSGGVR